VLLVVSENGARFSLEEIDDFSRLHVLANGDPFASQVLRVCGLTPQGHVFVQPAVLEELAGTSAAESEWRRQFHEMIDFAASSGWTDDRGAVRVHVVSAR
jgi:hypothetical protein